jgi:hypothetical protein
MAELNIKHGPFIVVRRVIGVINLICACLWIAVNLGDLNIFDLFYFIVFMISGGALLTNGFGTEKSYIFSGDDYLRIKWLNRFRAIIIKDNEIKKITLTRYKVVIEKAAGKNLNLNLDFLERDQKKEVYDYFIQYAKEKKLEFSMDYH